MKVLYCETGSGRGGSAASLYQFLAACRDTPIEPSVACFTDAARALFEPLGYPVHTLGAGGIGATIFRLWPVIGSEGIDLLHTNNDIYSHIATILGGRTRNVPIVAHHRAARRLTRAERLLWSRVERHVSVSAFVRDDLVEQGIDGATIEVVYDAIQPPAADAIDRTFARRKLGLDESALLVGSIGSLRPEKGLEVLVAAAGRFAYEKNLHFVLVGADFHRATGYGDRLRRVIAEQGMVTRFHFTGHMTDTQAWIAAMDLMVFPTLLPEGFGRAALEAMACGVPIVASAAGAIPEVVEDGVTGHLVEPGDAAALADKIEQVLKSDSSALVARAARVAATKFSVAAQVARMLEIYDTVMRRR